MEYIYGKENGWLEEKDFFEFINIRKIGDIPTVDLMYPNHSEEVINDIKHRFKVMDLNGKKAIVHIFKGCSFENKYKIAFSFDNVEISEFNYSNIVKVKDLNNNKCGLFNLYSNSFLLEPTYDDLEYIGMFDGHYKIEDKTYYDEHHKIIIVKVKDNSKEGIIKMYTDPEIKQIEEWVPIKYDKVKCHNLHETKSIGGSLMSFNHFMFKVSDNDLLGLYVYLDKYRDHRTINNYVYKYYDRYMIPSIFEDISLTSLTQRTSRNLYQHLDSTSYSDEELCSHIRKGVFKFKLNNLWGLYCASYDKKVIVPPMFKGQDDFYCFNIGYDKEDYINHSSFSLPICIYSEGTTYVVTKDGYYQLVIGVSLTDLQVIAEQEIASKIKKLT